jgi:CelD/BcsL family acetyltransferase involved in cellulose biosynthesis
MAERKPAIATGFPHGESMNLVVLTGNKALQCVNSEEFQSRWKTLHARCPWATACQHPDFVAPWYELYHAIFLPVIVLRETDDHSLEGLLTLALHRKGSKLTGAGERQAEYHGWIEASDTHNNFIRAAIQEVRTAFPGVDLSFKYLPPGIPLDWIDLKNNLGRFCALRSHPRPVMKIDAAAMDRQRTKKNNRQNYNRLRKMGDVQFERVTEHGHFIRIFDEMCAQYDFRQGALYQNMPFSNDPSKKLFYLELHKRGLLHTTVLTVDGEIAASHSGLLSEGRAVHVGINTHGPAFAAHSPGNLLLAMLGVQLAKENIPLLDLTPGGDGYKENFATEHDVAFELTIYSDMKTRLGKEAVLSLVRLSKARLHAAGYRTADIWTALGKLQSLRHPSFQQMLRKLRGRSLPRRCEYRLCQDRQAVSEVDISISKNRLNDILKFDACGRSFAHWAFLGTVMERMERSQHLYTFVDKERLLISCWVRTFPAAAIAQRPGQDPAPGTGAIVLSDLYVHRQLGNTEMVQRFIRQILFELKKLETTETVHYNGDLSAQLQTAIKKCGFIEESA